MGVERRIWNDVLVRSSGVIGCRGASTGKLSTLVQPEASNIDIYPRLLRDFIRNSLYHHEEGYFIARAGKSGKRRATAFSSNKRRDRHDIAPIPTERESCSHA